MRLSLMRKLTLIGCAAALAGLGSFNCKADAVLVTNFPLIPTPGTLAIPTGGFTLGQTFTFQSVWSNDWDLPLIVTFNFSVTEIDPFSNDSFRRSQTFGLPAGARNVTVTSLPTLSAADLNSANDFLEFGQLEFQIDSPEFTFDHVPEPYTWEMLAIGVAGLAWVKAYWRARRGV